MATNQFDGLIYKRYFINKDQREKILFYLRGLNPIWEMRYSKNNPPPAGDEQRELLRPVYWLGNWQFACLGYFHPPKFTMNTCVLAETFPPVLQNIVNSVEALVRKHYSNLDLPKDWHLNTCLINFYGSKIIDGKKVDTARVGEHKDFEPGPVASLSIGDRAFFQFISGQKKVYTETWLEDSSMLIFGGKKWKETYFHRVQRVEKKRQEDFKLTIDSFETRRINFTFRYVPKEFLVRYQDLPAPQKEDIEKYVLELSKNSTYWKNFS
ncbi:MAG: alpha-ketoglutarate-dependent dioxygenase AlkB [Bacteriovoracaceae bacterium]